MDRLGLESIRKHTARHWRQIEMGKARNRNVERGRSKGARAV
jgi:hypothetical protein